MPRPTTAQRKVLVSSGARPDAPTSVSAPRPGAPYRDPDVRRWLSAFCLSLLGDQIYFLALGWTASQIATDMQVGLILAAGSIPRAVLLLFGGAAADRYGPKRLVLVSDSARVLVMVVIATILAAGQPAVLLLVCLAVAFGVIDALFLPAVGAFLPRLVDDDQIARLQAMRVTAQRASLVAGAPLAGWIVAKHGLAVAFAASAVLFAFSVVILTFTKLRRPPGPAADHPQQTPDQGRTSLLTDVRHGLRYVRRHRLLSGLLVLSGCSEFGFIGPLNTGLPLLATEQGWGAEGMGQVLGAFAAGAGSAALFVVVRGRLPRAGLLSCLAVLVTAGSSAGIGLAPTVRWAVLAAVVMGLGAGTVGSLLTALILTATESDQVGRVMALTSLVTLGTIPLSYTITGFLASISSAALTFVLGSAVSALAAVATLTRRQIRSAELADRRR